MADKIRSKMEQEQPCWFTVNIPQNTTRLTSLQRITMLTKTSENNLKILVHFKNDRACFRPLNEKMYCSLIEATDCDIDPDSQDTYIVQYGRDVLNCKFFKYFFPKGMGTQLKYTHLPSNNRSNSENAEVIKQCSEVNVSVNDKTVSVKTGESQLDFQEDAKENYETCLMKVIRKFEASTLGSPARDETELLAEKPGANQNNSGLSNTDNFKTSAEAITINKELLHTEKSHFAVDIYGKELKHVRNSMNSDILELSTGNFATRTKIICQLNAGDETRTPHLKSGEGAGPTGSLQKARKSTAFVNFSTVNRKVGRKATKQSARRKKGTFKKKSRKLSKKTRKKKAQHFLKKRQHYNTCQGTNALNNNKKEIKEHRGERIYPVFWKEQIELTEIKEKKSKFQKTPTSGLNKKRKRRKTFAKEVVDRKIEKVEKRSIEELLMRRQKKPFRSKGWSWNMYDNFKEKYVLDEDAFTKSLFRRNSTDKYSKDIIKMLRELTGLLYHERTWKVNAYVYPSRRGKSSKSAQRRNQQGHTHSSQAAEGIPDQFPTQVSDAETGSLNLPPAELVQTSLGSIYQTYSSNTPAPTTNLMPSIDAERGLVSRIRGQLPESCFSRPQQPPRHPQYADNPSRQRSYSNWPTTNGQDPTRMAINGFFYTVRLDQIRCFQCGIGLEEWAEPDEPLFEHIKHSPDCQFLKDLLGQELLNEYRNNLLQDNQFQFASQSSSESQAPTVDRIRHPHYSELEARFRSYDNWPATSLQRPQDLADAGLFYTGFEDQCRCFTCDGGLQRWDADDDPWIEHARWFPHCAYVRQIKGQEYINMVQEAARQAREEEEDPTIGVPLPQRLQGGGPTGHGVAELRLEDTGNDDLPMPDLILPGQREGQERRENFNCERADCTICLVIENQRLNAIMRCENCRGNFRNILFLPCGHHILCDDCAENITTCPYCDTIINEKITTFWD